MASILFNFLIPYWNVADQFSFLDLITYYRPLFIIRDGNWPVVDIAVLLGFAALTWIVAGIVFGRRNLAPR